MDNTSIQNIASTYAPKTDGQGLKSLNASTAILAVMMIVMAYASNMKSQLPELQDLYANMSALGAMQSWSVSQFQDSSYSNGNTVFDTWMTNMVDYANGQKSTGASSSTNTSLDQAVVQVAYNKLQFKFELAKQIASDLKNILGSLQQITGSATAAATNG